MSAAATDLELAFAGPVALAAKVRSREVSPRELVELFVGRIEALNPALNAVRAVLAEQALAEAERKRSWDGLLAGVPIAVKDEIALAGQVATKGSRSYGPPASADAEAIRRLRAAGAIPIAVTNVPELMIFPWTATAANGITRNPWDPERTPGGSSGGSASAVAAGMVPAATASDGGGSIRIPAAACGLVGMKPTRGRVSSAPDAAGWRGMSVYGGLARTVADSALMLDAMQGSLPSDTYRAPAFDGSYLQAAATPPGRLRIAVSRRVPPPLMARVSADQRVAWERTAALLTDLGHQVIPRDPAYGLAQLEFVQTWWRVIYEDSRQVPDPSALEPLTRQMAAAGRWLVPAWRRDRLLAARDDTSRRITAMWDEIDVLLTPATATTAIAAAGGFDRPMPIAIDISARFTPFTPLFNLTGQPAIVVPAGFGHDGLPLSVQLVGRHGAEDTLYSLAAQIEAADPWAARRPRISDVAAYARPGAHG